MILRGVIIAVLFMIGFLTGDAKAQLFLENGKVSLAVSGGDHLNGTLVIHNTSTMPQNVKVYWADFEYKSPYDGTKKFLPAGTLPASAASWVTFSPQTFSVPPSGQQIVNYTVAAPAQVQEGHYGVLFFESSNPASTGQGDEVNLVTRVGCLFFIEPQNKNKTAQLQNIAVKGNSITLDFVNQGNVILLPRTTYYLMQQGGVVLLRGEAVKRYVPPGATAGLEIALKNKLAPGQYTLVVNSDLEDGDLAVKEIGLAVDAAGQFTIVNSQD